MLPTLLATATATRRERLCAALGASNAIVLAGSAPPRNYRANTYPFRASSHFLYFVGMPLEGAALLIADRRPYLLVSDRPADDDLWHGPVASASELTRATGLEVRPLAQLRSLVAAGFVATTPPVQLHDAERLSAALGRERSMLGREPGDEALLDAIVALRLAHDEGAIRELRRAADASVDAHLAGISATRPGLLEAEVCAAMESVIARRGFTTAYGSIVSVHGEVLHNHAHDQRMREGELLLADVGAETETGYAADITRTWPVSGRFSATQRDLYELVLAAQSAAIERVRPGTRFRDVHMGAARTLVDGLVQLGILRGEVDALVEDGAHALFFPHGIGHLLGLDVHDMEDLGDRAGYAPSRSRASQFGLCYLRLDRDLAPGMVVTIEPGFYQVPSLLRDPARVGLCDTALVRARLESFADVRGIRIEDDVLVTATGSEVLTAALPKSVAAIESLVGRAS